MKERLHQLLIVLVMISGLMFVSALPAQAGVNYYVKVGATGTGDSWENAFATLGVALDKASSGDTIHVAAGNYTGPFTMKDDVTVLGGYPDNVMDAEFSAREFPGSGNNLTRLLGSGSSDGNGRVLIQPAAFDAPTLWEGFVLLGGKTANAELNGTLPDDDSFVHGGGAYLLANGILRNCIVQGNTAFSRGGGIYAGEGSRVEGCLVTGNKASDGAGIYSSGATVLNCTVVDNTLPPVTGDYYYSDGSWSKTYTSDNFVGIVCWVNPENRYSGLILHIKENETELNDWSDSDGWAKGIDVGDFNDWHLPEVNELMEIWDKKDILNSSLEVVDGTKLPNDDRYWSGSVRDNNYAWYVYFNRGNEGFGVKGLSDTRARAVRAF